MTLVQQRLVASERERDEAPTPCTSTEKKRLQLSLLNGIGPTVSAIMAREVYYQRSSLSGYELADFQALVFASDVNAANAVGEQQTLDAVDVRRPLLHQPATFAMRAPEILLVDTGGCVRPTRRAARPGTRRSAHVAASPRRSDRFWPVGRAD